MTTLYKERKPTINLQPCRRTEASMGAYACQEKINDSTILKNKCPVRTRHQALFCSWTLALRHGVSLLRHKVGGHTNVEQSDLAIRGIPVGRGGLPRSGYVATRRMFSRTAGYARGYDSEKRSHLHLQSQ